jgi:glyoxylase-like metal-dependent hydrolase (beta-lactamase superfamily II)
MRVTEGYAMRPIPTAQVPGVHHRRVGEMIVTTLSDGFVDPPTEAVEVITPAEAEAMILAGTGRPKPRISVNMFALRWPDRTVLVDAGSGTMMGPTCGRMPDNMAAAGIRPEEVGTILLTHVHPDHSGGITSDAGAALFPNADIVVHEAEIAHWSDDARMSAATERQRVRYFEGGRFRLRPYDGRIRTFRDGDEVLPGITALLCDGHTPGHCAYRIRSGTEEILIWGDTVHVPEIQVPRPDVYMMYDFDGPKAAASRAAVLALAERDDLLIGGMHLHFPGLGRVTARDGTYQILTEPWTYTL